MRIDNLISPSDEGLSHDDSGGHITMKTSNGKRYERNCAALPQHLKLKGLQPKMIEVYSRAIRRIGERFEGRIGALSEQQLTDYFIELVASNLDK